MTSNKAQKKKVWSGMAEFDNACDRLALLFKSFGESSLPITKKKSRTKEDI